MPNNVSEYKSVKSNSTYTVTTETGRAYLGVTGEAATNPKVIAALPDTLPFDNNNQTKGEANNG